MDNKLNTEDICLHKTSENKKVEMQTIANIDSAL
jgi:hypothetical protein